MRQAKSMCNPSSRMINSLEWHNPGSSPRERIQKMAAKEEEKKTPSTIAKAITLVPKEYSASEHHLRLHSALSFTVGIVCTALNSLRSSPSSVINSNRKRAYVSACTFSLSYLVSLLSGKQRSNELEVYVHHDLEPVKTPSFGHFNLSAESLC